MIDLRSRGIKCRALRTIESHQGIVRPSTERIIQYEVENLGRRLVNVDWDNGLRLNVFPDEIEIIDGDLLWQ